MYVGLAPILCVEIMAANSNEWEAISCFGCGVDLCERARAEGCSSPATCEILHVPDSPRLASSHAGRPYGNKDTNKPCPSMKDETTLFCCGKSS